VIEPSGSAELAATALATLRAEIEAITNPR
jgi:hypothetical protein